MDKQWLDVLIHLLVATAAGGLIGLERSYHGRPAGFRTHTLVCVASSLLMLVTMYESKWFSGSAAIQTIRVDPTRMAQGIMTGIGFLGAGVIMREGLNVRGLTTSASIWITAAIGILAGVGFNSAVVITTGITLVTLTVLRKVEGRIPAQVFAHNTIVSGRDKCLSEATIRKLHMQNGFSVANVSYQLLDQGKQLEYRMTVRTMDGANIEKLARALMDTDEVVEFDISVARD